jgi:hypothetical protein
MEARNWLGYLSPLFVASSVLGGCGATVPDIKETWDADLPGDPDISKNKPPFSGTAQIEFEIRRKIYCELKAAVKDINRYHTWASDTPNGLRINQQMLPNNWIAQLSLSLEVDESSALNPGVTLNQVLPNAIKTFGVGNTVTTGQSFSFGFGGTLSSTATRTDKFDPVYSIAWLMRPYEKGNTCAPENDLFFQNHIVPAQSSPFLIISDLGIEKWLMGALLAEELLPSQPPINPPAKPKKKTAVLTMVADAAGGGGGGSAGSGGGGGGGALGPFAVSEEIKFVIVSNGNINPTWKLVQISANTGSSPLFGVGRTRTHDLIITIGPNNQNTQNANFALQIGNAVGNNVRSVPISSSPLF